MINSYQEQVFYHYILENPSYLKVAQDGFFNNDKVRDLFNVAREHALKYKEPPSKDQLLEIVKIKGLQENLNQDIIEALYNSKVLLQEYDDAWLEENVGAWIQVRNAELAFRKGAAYLKTSTITSENASEVVENLRHMMTTDMSIDFKFQMGSDFFDPKSHLQTRLARTHTGYAYVDKCLKGGWWKGALIGILGGPKSGKSLWLQNLAGNSVMNGHNTAYITCELQEEIVTMRIGSNLLNINIDEYEEKSEDQDFMRNKLNNLKKDAFVSPGVLSIKEFPSGAASVNDIRAHLLKEQEMLGIKFDNVFVDYLNIMKNWRNPNTENLYIKIKQISEDLRAMAMEEEWCVITVTQTNRGGWENEDLRISNVSESAALIHTVDALFGIITSPELKARGEYYLKYLADRVSGMENTRKKFKVNFKFSKIEEDMQSNIEDLDYMLNQAVGGTGQHRGTPNQQNLIKAEPVEFDTAKADPPPPEMPGNKLFFDQ